MAALYVGNLAPDVTEDILFDIFSTVCPITSIHVCRDLITRRSLGYAYVNFRNKVDAELALDILNFDDIVGNPTRTKFPQVNSSSLNKLGVSNVVINNLDKSIDEKVIFNKFSDFGTILSCKIARDDTGKSRGYGFIQFKLEQSVVQCIKKVNGTMLNGKKVFISRFDDKNDCDDQKAKSYTNVYIKNIDKNVNDNKLYEMFSKYGKITSWKVMLRKDGSSRGFGFVAFENPKEAENAVAGLDGKESPEGKIYYVGRAQKKTERQHKLKQKYEQYKIKCINRHLGVNLYVKNLDDTINDERLRKEFSVFGTITSAKVMMDDGRKRGFGFVCFSSPEEATKAIINMNGRMVGTKHLYVALAQRKEDRKAQLDSQNLQYNTNIRMQSISPICQPTCSNGHFVTNIPQPQHFYGPTQIPQIYPQLRWCAQPQVTARMPHVTAAGYSCIDTQYPNIGPLIPVPMSQQTTLTRNDMVDRNVRPSIVQQQTMGIVQAGCACVPGVHGSGVEFKYTPNM